MGEKVVWHTFWWLHCMPMVQCALTLRVDCRLRVHSVNPDNTPAREEILAGLREGVGVSLKHKHLWSALVVGSEVSPLSPLAACTDTSGNRRSVILLYFIRKFARRVSDLHCASATVCGVFRDCVRALSAASSCLGESWWYGQFFT